jgi:hypothetical protein
MIEEYLDLVAVMLMAAMALSLIFGVQYISTPSVCQAVKLVLENPGSELRIYGRFEIRNYTDHLYINCGLWVPKDQVLTIEKAQGYMIIGSTAEGKLYIR